MQPEQFGKYRIKRKLSGGGMGRVFQATDGESGRLVALKLIDVGDDAESREVLEAERRGAILQWRLSAVDDHVAGLLDYGEQDGCFYIAMEYVEGEDLSEALARGPLPTERAVKIASELCSVLDHAHTFRT